MCETPCGMLNAIGLENIGIDAFIAKLPFLCTFDTEVIVNFFGTDEDEYVQMARGSISGSVRHRDERLCPNIKKGGIEFGKAEDTQPARGARCASPPQALIVKLSPMVTNIGEMALAAQEGGAALTCSTPFGHGHR